LESKARIAGILSIISGAFGVLGLGWAFLGLFLFGAVFRQGFMPSPPPREFFVIMTVFYLVIGLCSLLIGVLAIIGGIFAIKKKRWGLALAGAIAGTVTFFPCGIPAIVLISMAKKEEFSLPQPPSPPEAKISL
jgi:hypothetical protein